MEHSPEHESHPHESHDLIKQREIVTNADRPPLLSWGAILGGLVFVIGISYLLYLLGFAIGASVADASDGEAIGNGMTTGAIVWMVVSSLIAYFLGSLLCARLSGKVDSTVGMLHGMTLWGIATTLMLILSYMGISSLLQTGLSLASTTAEAAATATSRIASSTGNAGYMMMDAAGARLTDNVQARIKRRAASVIANSEAQGGEDVSAEEVEQTIENIDAETMEKIATQISMGELTAARETLQGASELNRDEVREIVEGISNEFEEALGTDGNQKSLVEDISSSLKRQAADMIASMDAAGGTDVSSQEVRNALNQMTPDTMQTVAMRLVEGDTQGAKDSLSANTNLSVQEINAIVNGVNDDVSRTIDKYQETANEAIETASSYTQAVLWTAFISSAMGLAVSLLGGWLGAETSRKLYVEVHA